MWAYDGLVTSIRFCSDNATVAIKDLAEEAKYFMISCLSTMLLCIDSGISVEMKTTEDIRKRLQEINKHIKE